MGKLKRSLKKRIIKKLNTLAAQAVLLLFMFGVLVSAITAVLVIFSLISGLAWLLGMHPVSLFLLDIFRGGM